MSHAIEARALTKRFGGVTALDAVDLTVEEGSVFGFLGPNGAGKTTAIRILTGLARADAGSVSIFRHAPASAEARSLIGFLPDVPGFYGWMRAEEYLRFTGSLFGLDKATLEERVPVLLDLSGLRHTKTRLSGFSRGMRQRLGVAQALVNAPRLLLLDEPTSALDPIGRKDVLEMIASLRGRTTVFFSTHILADVERVCDRVAILDRGRIVADASPAQLKKRHAAHRIDVRVTSGGNLLRAALAEAEWVSSVGGASDLEVAVAVSDVERARRELPALVASLGLGLDRFESGEVSLEEAFVELVEGEA